jgi:lipopolysaccharide transport system ATP-binding protein
MSSEPIAISGRGLGKAYQLYDRYDDRLLQLLFGRWKRYYREFWVMRDIDITVKKGERIGLIGRNGSGKTTLLQIMCGITEPTTGTLAVTGRIAPILALGAAFDYELTGRENAFVAGAILGVSRKQMAERIDEVEAFAAIGEFFNRPAKMYSSGMVARLSFAICAHASADILIVDEALSVGDGAFQERSRRFIERFAETGTVLMVSHEHEQIERLCERVLWLDRGKLREEGEPHAVMANYLKALEDEPDTGDRFTDMIV